MRKFIFMFTLCLLAFGAAQIYSGKPQISAAATVLPAERIGVNFIKTYLSDSDGIIRYSVSFRETTNTAVVESMGQMMEYFALAGDAANFNKYAQVTDKYFLDPRGYYYWEINRLTKKNDPVTASLDDLRIFKAYYIAHENKLGDYSAKLAQLADSIYRFDVDRHNYPTSYYFGESNTKGSDFFTYYLDAGTLKKLASIDSRWQAPLSTTLEIINKLPENKHGFYPKNFTTNNKVYVWEDTVNMVENLYTALFAQEAGKDTSNFEKFLQGQIEHGAIHNHYDKDSAEPEDENESVAVYALAARFMAAKGDMESARFCYERALEFQLNIENTFYGGFGDDDTGLVYAFDQLEALLMLRTVNYE